METKIKFQSITSVETSNLEGLQQICKHLKEELLLDLDGPKTSTETGSFHVSLKNGQNDYHSIAFIFRNNVCEIETLFLEEGVVVLCSYCYDMTKYDDAMLSAIRKTVREWIYDGIEPKYK